MTHPLSHPDLRRTNMDLLLSTLLRSGATTRARIERESGLSKATVSRLVDTLIAHDLVERFTITNEPGAIGRRPEGLRLRTELGQVVGVGFGVRRTVLISSELIHHQTHYEALATPRWGSGDAAVAWLAERIEDVRRTVGAPILGAAIALPARTVDGGALHPPLSLSVLEHRDLASELSERTGIEVEVDSDANMALSALIADGVVDAHDAPLLLNMGTVLTMAVRRYDGSYAQGRGDAFGNFSLIPFHSALGDSTLGAMLSTHGLEQLCDRLGYELESLPELWEQPEPRTEPVREAFAIALVQALRVICVMADPPTVLLAGRLTALVDAVLPRVKAQLHREVANPPRLLSLPLHGTEHSPAHGALHVALSSAHRRLRAQLARLI